MSKVTHSLSYAHVRDMYYRSFGDRELRLNLLRFLNQNRQLKKLQNLLAGFFLTDDFICTDRGTTESRLRGDCPECGLMLCGDCSYAVCWRCAIRTDARKIGIPLTDTAIGRMSDKEWNAVFRLVMKEEYQWPMN